MLNFNQELKEITIDGFVLSDELVYEFLHSQKKEDRNEKLAQAIRIGVLALENDRFSSFLDNIESELGVQLESLKIRLDLKNQTFHESTKKGTKLEEDVCTFLEDYFQRHGFSDTVELTGKQRGEIKRNKTGDVLACVDGSDTRRIAIECKLDKQVPLGGVGTNDIEKNRKDTAWSQLLEADVNRDARISIIVYDRTKADASILKNVDGVAYIPELGFVCVIDYQAGNYQNLAIAYNLARSIALQNLDNDGNKVNGEFVNMLIQRILADINDIANIEGLVKNNIDTNKTILKKIKKSLLTIEFTRNYLEKYLKEGGVISMPDLLDFYQRESIRTKYKGISEEIELLSKAED